MVLRALAGAWRAGWAFTRVCRRGGAPFAERIVPARSGSGPSGCPPRLAKRPLSRRLRSGDGCGTCGVAGRRARRHVAPTGAEKRQATKERFLGTGERLARSRTRWAFLPRLGESTVVAEICARLPAPGERVRPSL